MIQEEKENIASKEKKLFFRVQDVPPIPTAVLFGIQVNIQ